MIEHYDAESPPDPETWLASDEDERLLLVLAYHRDLEDDHPPAESVQMHAAIHVIVENHLALGQEVPTKTLERLRGEGLSRHEAIHAIGTVVAEHIFSILRGEEAVPDPNPVYEESLKRLTRQSWYDDYGEPESEPGEAPPKARHFKPRPRGRSR